MPRHRRRRRSRPNVPVVLAAMALAITGSLALATLAPPTSSGAPQPAAARVASPDPVALGPVTSALAGAVEGLSAGASAAAENSLQPARAVPAAPADLSGYRWPLLHPRITLPFGPWHDASRIVDGKPYHDGLDLATFCGDRIVAAHAGVVLAAGRHYDSKMGWVGDLGPYFDRLDAESLWVTLPIVVVIDDGDGYRSVYAHFEKIVVTRGDTVQAGQLVGYEGRTGHASGCHLHYGLFSPEETARFGIDPTVVEHMKLPAWEIARIDPLLVLPPRAPSIAAPVTTISRPLAAWDDPF